MPTGTVKWFDTKKGFGFVVGDDKVDVFVHFSVIEGDGFRSLKDGELVEYEVSEGPKGKLATNVRRLRVKAQSGGMTGAAGKGMPMEINEDDDNRGNLIGS